MFTRRDFIKLASVYFLDMAKKKWSDPKSIIFVWLSGGPDHRSTFLTSNVAGYQSITGNTSTIIPGVYLGGYFEKINKILDKITIVRSFGHTDSGHQGATELLLTGKYHRAADNGELPINPSIGSVISRKIGSHNYTTGIPTYVATTRIFADGPAWLGNHLQPFDPSGDGVKNLTLNVDSERFNQRILLLKTLNKSQDVFIDESVELLQKNIKDAFNIELEDEFTQNLYSSTQFSRQLLLARRLCEYGCSIVNVSYGSWDTHNDQDIQFKTKIPVLDGGLYSLITDITNRGLENNILVVMVGEFGRTKQNILGGSDHWNDLCSLCLFGGKYAGQVIGECDRRSDYPVTNRFTPPDLLATMLDHLGITEKLEYMDTFGRPILINDGKVIM